MSQMWRRREKKILVESGPQAPGGGEEGEANRVGSNTKKRCFVMRLEGLAIGYFVRGFFVISLTRIWFFFVL